MIEKKETRGGKRLGSGRPSLFEGEKKAINLMLMVDAIDLLTKKSEQAGISRSDLINKLIFDNLK